MNAMQCESLECTFPDEIIILLRLFSICPVCPQIKLNTQTCNPIKLDVIPLRTLLHTSNDTDYLL